MAPAPAADDIREPARAADRDLVSRYAAAFERADLDALVRLLRADVVMEMPPQPAWFRGRDAVARFFGAQVMRAPGDFAMIPVAANGQPGMAVYQRRSDGRYLAHAIQVLTPTATGLARIVSFNEPRLFGVFGL